ncbi:Gfo/Idh/MocA family oxidoreductase [Parasphingorhabdus flavimaris]|uniref:Gfo/Idh/MocA family oxidoreductase n=1 Tax=Parasphingorhabdus flavimaris TaxID=266812 RepID=A0ABX2N5R0_9SPHN|nr:bi-domain-containing oxidoreductase [Parasphingorhabdus flavimaris]NVD29033.1 Gfo/Idh/MocA family oxidoreductase [Parasphingorhabdus flavimaris]
MKQIIQDMSSGATSLIDSPRPAPSPSSLVIDTECSLISVGTERMLVDFGKASLISKARQQPDKVAQVLNKVRTDGLTTTVEAVRSKLSQPIPLGYSNVGIVADAGSDTRGFSVGDRVLSNGPHAETVRVPQNLCALIPDNVPDEHAAFTVVGSIGLQGVRLAQPTIGESVVVMGAGLIGLMTIQILLANGCRVLAIDFDGTKLALAESWGAEICNLSDAADPVSAGMAFSAGRGVDAVLITASTKSDDPVRHAAQMSRKRGRIVLVGVTGLNLSRDDFYQKELSFQVSCSYGPGRYDHSYEEDGQDYPLGFVRWTEQRNFEAILDLMSSGKIDVSAMISKTLPFEEAPVAFQGLANDKGLLGVLLKYESAPETRLARTVKIGTVRVGASINKPRIAVIGAGNYASRILVPALAKIGANIGPIVTSGGLSGAITAKRFGVEKAGTDIDQILSDSEIIAAVVATQHNTHASITARLLNAGKSVFVEKPLAIDRAQLELVRSAYEKQVAVGSAVRLMVGYNRRYSPYTIKMKSLLDKVNGPKSFIMTMNAGAIPADVWIQDRDIGGGRIIGEACHLIDLMRFLAGNEIVEIKSQKMGESKFELITEDKAIILLRFADGSHGSIHYLANGAPSFPKERIEVFANGGILQIDNFKNLRGFGWPGFRKKGGLKQDKGQEACINQFYQAICNGMSSPIPPEEIFEVAEATIKAAEILREQR